MNACAYTNRGEEVPLGVECALPYLEPVAKAIFLQRTDSGEHEGRKSLVPLRAVHSTPSPIPGGDTTQHLVKGDRHAATSESPDPVHS
jgi:hypothetical protein